MREQCRYRLYSSLSDHAILFQIKVRFFHYPVCFKSEVFINRNIIGIMGFQRNQHLVFLGIIYHFIHQKFCQPMMLVPGAVAGIFTSDSALISYTTWAMRIYMAGIFAMGFQIACQQSFMALGQAKVSLLLACLRKIILLIPLIFLLPHLVADPVFGVFLAEPVSDILAATITTITFFARFDRILEKGAARV